ncbi:hypothetical protein J2W14_001695 [Pseudarthrobacter oxydans]|nr:hypothetical protein [Pseudarthrobacter oxydans]
MQGTGVHSRSTGEKYKSVDSVYKLDPSLHRKDSKT